MERSFRMRWSTVLLFVIWMKGLTVLQAQETIVIPRPDVQFRNDSLFIRYDLQGCRKDQSFKVWLEVSSSTGKRLTPLHISGDAGVGVSCGEGKEIVWDLLADSLIMEDVLEVKVVAETEVILPSGNKNLQAMFFSLLFPGSGIELKKQDGRPYWLLGAVGYVGVASTLWFDQLKRSAYDDWQTEQDPDLAESYHQDYLDNKNRMIISAAATGAWWLGGLAWTALTPGHRAPGVTVGHGRLYLAPAPVTRRFATGVSMRFVF